MNDLFISEKNISLQKKSTTQVNAQCTLEIQLVQRLNLMTLGQMTCFFLLRRKNYATYREIILKKLPEYKKIMENVFNI